MIKVFGVHMPPKQHSGLTILSTIIYVDTVVLYRQFFYHCTVMGG